MTGIAGADDCYGLLDGGDVVVLWGELAGSGREVDRQIEKVDEMRAGLLEIRATVLRLAATQERLREEGALS